MLDAAAIHSALAGAWPDVLERLGIAEEFLRNRHGPCPSCGGKDRFRFDDKEGRGTWICNRCGAGDAFKLLQLVHGWDFAEARRRMIEVAGLDSDTRAPTRSIRRATPEPETPAAPTERVLKLLHAATSPAEVPDVVEYLRSRCLWPLPSGCTLRAHRAARYFDDGEFIGRYPSILAEVRDKSGFAKISQWPADKRSRTIRRRTTEVGRTAVVTAR